MLASPASGVPYAEELRLGKHAESSEGDTMHKLVLVEAGMLDLEGEKGGWLIIPNHMVFIPAERAFNIRASREARLRVAHLSPLDAEWLHHGCWITAVPDLARHMVAHALRWGSSEVHESEAARHFFRTLSHLCQDWFSTPRILWMPAAVSPEVRAAVGYVRDDLRHATLEDAALAARCSTRTLQRRCKEELDFTWRSFVREVRIMRAMELLAQRRHQIGEVSRETGFANVSAFTASFSARLGISPSEFLRRSNGAKRR